MEARQEQPYKQECTSGSVYKITKQYVCTVPINGEFTLVVTSAKTLSIMVEL